MTPEKQKLAASVYNALIRSLMAIIINHRKLAPDTSAIQQQFKLLLISLAYGFISDDGNDFIFKQPLALDEIDNREVATRLILSKDNMPLIELEETDSNHPELIHLLCSTDDGSIYTYTLQTKINLEGKYEDEYEYSSESDDSGHIPSSCSSQTDDNPEANESFRDQLWSSIRQLIDESPTVTAKILFTALSDFSKKIEDQPILSALQKAFTSQFYGLTTNSPQCLLSKPFLLFGLSKLFNDNGLQISPGCNHANIKTINRLTKAMDQIHPGFR